MVWLCAAWCDVVRIVSSHPSHTRTHMHTPTHAPDGTIVMDPASTLPVAQVKPANGKVTWLVDSAAAASLSEQAEELSTTHPMQRTVGIIGAMPQEIAQLKKHVQEQCDHVVNDFLTVTRGNP